MRVKDIIKVLQEQGYEVETYTRTKKTSSGTKSDSVRITRIRGNGIEVSFSKSTSLGNKYARKMLGVELSNKVVKQLEKNRKKISKLKLTKKQQELLKKFNKKQRKLKKEEYGKVVLRKMRKKRGWEGTKKALSNIIKHNEGWAYDKNIQILLERLKEAINFNMDSYSFWRVREFIKTKKKILDESLVEIYKILYNWEHGQLTNKEAETYMLEALKR